MEHCIRILLAIRGRVTHHMLMRFARCNRREARLAIRDAVRKGILERHLELGYTFREMRPLKPWAINWRAP